jgi:hypothetical protein
VNGDPVDADVWTDGAVYAVARGGFRREWGSEWVTERPVRPELRVLVGPQDFPLADVVIGLSTADEFRDVRRHLRAAKRQRAAPPPARLPLQQS